MKDKYRSRTHCLLLYPENEQHAKAVEIIKQSYDYAMILHDKDTWTKADEEANPEHKEGTVKKPHWHIVLRFNQGTWSSAICKNLGITENYIEEAKKVDNALLYLIHYNDTDKAQYSIDEVKGNMAKRVRELINKNEKSEGEKVTELIEWIESDDTIVTVTDFAKYCAMNGYWAEFRRSGAIFCKIIEEHNKKVERMYNQE